MRYHSLKPPGPILAGILLIIALPLLGTSSLWAQDESNDIDLFSPDRAMIEQDTKQILNRPEFRHLTRERQINSDSPFDLKDLIKDNEPAEQTQAPRFLTQIAGSIILILSYIAIVCACGLIIYLLYLAIKGFQFKEKTTETTDSSLLQGEVSLEQLVSPAEKEASLYLERAKKLAQSGDYHNAIIQLIYGSMSFIERAGWIRFRKGLTYRDYIRAARPHGAPGDSFRQIIRTYEPLGFGRREATREHFENTLSFYESAFQK